MPRNKLRVNLIFWVWLTDIGSRCHSPYPHNTHKL
ncbi:hypothetical protein BMETH_2935_1 [methanotrophic bacterial endosymbiont of Bathymodiolus sp.]|nr:hypothetical protein BMETH_2935_1 [methanotrophic bacterial endosymbiont of Bathymodiolus sp.]